MKKVPWYLQPISDRNGQISSMRIVIYLFSYFIASLIDAVCDYIRLFGKAGTAVDWMGLSAFIGSLTALISLLIYQKVRQTKIEYEKGNSDHSGQ